VNISFQKAPQKEQGPLPERPRAQGAIPTLLRQHRELVSAFIFFVVMMIVFTIASPGVWLNSQSYSAVFVSLPIYIILTVSLVFVVVSGEIDLSFSSVVGVSALVFTEFYLGGVNPYICLILAILAGGLAGVINGVLVCYIGLSSLVVTLGMNFFWAGFIQVMTNGYGAPLASLQNTTFHNLFVGQVGIIPVQMFWAALFAVIGMLLFTHHKYGAYVRFVGDNPEAAGEMGINVRMVKVISFIYVGLASGFAGVLAILINNNFYPTTGSGYLLSVLAAIFVGGTPVIGGVGTVAGAVVGSFTVGFIESGIVAAGLTGFWTQLVYGIVIVLSLITHRINSPQHKKAGGW
jgi:ribose/xylose/arabinose/galactoside ABC-type transport system permease subunit